MWIWYLYIFTHLFLFIYLFIVIYSAYCPRKRHYRFARYCVCIWCFVYVVG